MVMDPSRLNENNAFNNTHEIPTAYQKCGDYFKRLVHNFDDPERFRELRDQAKDASSKNFVLDFGKDAAWCAFNLEANDMKEVLNNERPKEANTRWINIWGPEHQTELVRELAKKYEFSDRLGGLMSSQPFHQRTVDHLPAPRPSSIRSRFTPHRRMSPKLHKRSFLELDAGVSSKVSKVSSEDLFEDLGHYDIVNDIWHWSSIDLGQKYLCLGYNLLYDVQPDSSGNADKDLPRGQRVWHWLVLCHDKTVISIVEGGPIQDLHLVTTDSKSRRRNAINIFEQLSVADDRTGRNPISLVPIRKRTEHQSSNVELQPDASGLLFYYLFDDWYTTWRLLAKREHQFDYELKSLRKEMMNQASLENVQRLYSLGRQLAILKKMYQSYVLLIEKVLEKSNNNQMLEPVENSSPTQSHSRDNQDFGKLNISLSSGASDRFERLRDRIKLYVLSEIQECIDTKESLMTMNFNLITIKESDAVERLTRITILLAKVTILFLPVSLMTSYFSAQLEGQIITIPTYWIAFAVILTLSYLVLYIFGKLSGTTEGKMVYRPINQVIFGLGRTFIEKLTGR